MTNDLISRSELLKKAIGVSEFDDGWERVLRAVPVLDIEMAEAVDAVPVVHAKWEWVLVEENPKKWILTCSACKGGGIDEHDNYCRHCGAKMDAEGDEP